MIEQLAFLLLPIEALLNHQDFNLRSKPSSGLVGLFRGMWFLCSLFHFSMFEGKNQIAMDWVRQMLGNISSKTPAIAVEVMNLAKELEYSTVIRRGYAYTVRPRSCELCGSELLARTADFETQGSIGEARTT